jgi:AraC family transcriptional activator of pobA
MPHRRLAPAAALPSFALYGEASSSSSPLLHIEKIQARSSLYEWEIQAHVHQGLHQVLWLNSGPGEMILDESRSACTGPAAAVIPPNVAHAFRFSPQTDGHVLSLSAAALAEGDAAGFGQALQTLFAQPLILRPEAAEAQHLAMLLACLQAESDAADRDSIRQAPGAHFANASPACWWLARCVVWRLAACARLAQQATQPEPAGSPSQRALYTRWVLLLEEHYREHWPVSRYAQRLGLSEERLNRLVKSQTQLTAQAVLHARLTREACRRLVHVAAPVSQLAFALGFEDPAYFCRFFKRQTGYSPRQYRQRMAGA